ncbi:MAG: type II toxin-antitoxin system VapC family toxin [Chloroflexi bacterium]|nr:type II toxin-antitoxin system VapC family toxin [Chloroflexota bacterium]
MIAYLLDADWVIQALARQPRAVGTLRRLAPARIAISWVTVGEIYEGAFGSPSHQAHLAVFREFLRPFVLLGLNDPIMERFAEIRSLLRRRGEIISDFDIILGAVALHHDLTVLTFNLQHLRRIPELKLYQPSSR